MNHKIYKVISGFIKGIFKDNIAKKRMDNSDIVLYYERAQHLTFLFKKRIRYETSAQELVLGYLKEGMKVFDIGANIGQYAMILSRKVGHTGSVYSFEPDVRNFAFLNFNVIINRCKNVTCINEGLGGKQEVLKLYRDTETGGRTTSFIKEFAGENFTGLVQEVRIRPLDEFIERFGYPDFFKIDVEGFECEVLKGLHEIRDKSMYFIEVRSETRDFVYSFFNTRGFKCYCLETKKMILQPDEIPGFANLLFQKS